MDQGTVRTRPSGRGYHAERSLPTWCGSSFIALVYKLGNFPRTLATPEPTKEWSLTNLREKLIKIGAKIITNGRYVAFQMAEVAIPRHIFREILQLIVELQRQPPPP